MRYDILWPVFRLRMMDSAGEAAAKNSDTSLYGDGSGNLTTS
jgi:hypothetical protein